jgi:ABC-type multidrug transport system fused ATPase/permease subunit
MSVFGQTFDKWIRYRIVQAGILLIVTISVIFLYLPQIIVVEFWIEILALFFALIFGFYWERAHESILHENKLAKVLDLFYQELRKNKENIPQILSYGRGDYLPYYLSTSVWDVYNEYLGELETDFVDVLTSIYYKTFLLNRSITSKLNDPSLSAHKLSEYLKIRDELNDQLNSFLSGWDSFYP